MHLLGASKGRQLKLMLIYALVLLVLEVLLLHYFVLIKVHGSSMEPALHDGDRMVLQAADGLDSGQVVIFTPPDAWIAYADVAPDTKFVKRVLAGPGDELRFDGERFWVNGVSSVRAPLFTCFGEKFKTVLNSSQVFVVGDNTGVSVDSRRIFCEGMEEYYIDVEGIKYLGKIVLTF